MSGALLVTIMAVLGSGSARAEPDPATPGSRSASTVKSELRVIIDDFVPQPYQGDSEYRFNRLGGDRGSLNYSLVDLGPGLLTTTITNGRTWGGLWTSLNHPIGEKLPIDFSAALPDQIRPAYQSQITGVTAEVVTGTAGITFRLELKDRNGLLQWSEETVLAGGPQTVSADLPPLGAIKEFLWVMDDAQAGDYVVLDSVSLTITTQIIDTATAAFVWSYGMLLNNMDAASGLVRDKGRQASGDFDAIQATGSLAAATALAAQLDIVDIDDARQIVATISDTLLLDVPRHETGLWPHFVISQTGAITIAPGTEWSSVDTAIAAFGLLDGQNGLGLDASGTEAMLGANDWDEMVYTGHFTGGIAHGYAYDGDQLDSLWDVFGGDTWLVELAYAIQNGQATTLTYPSPPTANGSGFIDELAWLYVLPPTELDYWGNDWPPYRLAAAQAQIDYFSDHYPDSCFAKLGLFGLSAAEVPVPEIVLPWEIYQAFGVGGRFAEPNDGAKLFDARAVTPHYSAMIATLYPQEATAMWAWLINQASFSPLNNIESLMFPVNSDCAPEDVRWNHLKGSWNLALQTLGWGNYLVQRNGQTPATWLATMQNAFVKQGYGVLVPGGIRETYLSIIKNG
jgi:hypothetical protein